jgi:hypothetical protein
MVYLLDTAKDAFDIILQIGAGTGLLYLMRWFWWRVNAWCEVVAMISSFAVSVVLFVLRKNGDVIPVHHALIITVAVTTVCWILTALLGPQTKASTLAEFYKKIRPFGPGWAYVRRQAGIPESGAAAGHENFPLALLGWTAGVAVIWSALFTIGNFLYGRIGYCLFLLGIFVASGAVLLWVINRLWSGSRAAAAEDRG